MEQAINHNKYIHTYIHTYTHKHTHTHTHTHTYIHIHMFLNEDILLCLNSKSKTKIFKSTAKHNSEQILVFYCGNIFRFY